MLCGVRAIHIQHQRDLHYSLLYWDRKSNYVYRLMQWSCTKLENHERKKKKHRHKNLYPSVLLNIPCFGLIITEVSLVTVSMHSMLANCDSAARRTSEKKNTRRSIKWYWKADRSRISFFSQNFNQFDSHIRHRKNILLNRKSYTNSLKLNVFCKMCVRASHHAPLNNSHSIS